MNNMLNSNLLNLLAGVDKDKLNQVSNMIKNMSKEDLNNLVGMLGMNKDGNNINVNPNGNEVKEINPNTSTNPIFDIVSSIQSKLNESNNGVASPQTENNNKKDLSGLDISKIVDMLNSSGINNFSNVNSPKQTPNFSGLDLGTIMNFQNILSGLNQNDPRQNLLSSLKPFLRETRQKNIDTYITLLGVMKAFNIFTSKDRD